jgi:hypothetical protein
LRGARAQDSGGPASAAKEGVGGDADNDANKLVFTSSGKTCTRPPVAAVEAVAEGQEQEEEQKKQEEEEEEEAQEEEQPPEEQDTQEEEQREEKQQQQELAGNSLPSAHDEQTGDVSGLSMSDGGSGGGGGGGGGRISPPPIHAVAADPSSSAAPPQDGGEESAVEQTAPGEQRSEGAAEMAATDTDAASTPATVPQQLPSPRTPMTPNTQQRADWARGIELFNSKGAKKGIRAMVEAGLLTSCAQPSLCLPTLAGEDTHTHTHRSAQ